MQCVWNVLLDPLRNQPHDKLACSKPHLNPLVDRDLAKKQQLQSQQQHFQLKRKRTNSLETPQQKRQKSDTSSADATVKCDNKDDAASSLSTSSLPSAPISSSSATAQPLTTADQPSQPSQSSDPTSTSNSAQVSTGTIKLLGADNEAKARTRAHERVEANINLQILLKHEELRLIEQELGKCQVALEQLRRCHVIPYPGQPGSPNSFQSIASGSGPALEPAPGYSRPDYPAPFGVVDGPYSRHYAQWLIPDPSFDPSLPRQPRATTSSFHAVPARSTRGSYDTQSGFSTPRVGRPSLASQNAAAQSNYSVPRDRHAPLIVHRPSDGKLVKVVCKVCGKKDSANVQGFTNHCRIAHGINYASHSEAIIDCGHPVGNDEAPPTATPIESKPASIVSTPQQVAPAHAPASAPPVGKPFVHPLITAPISEPKSKQSIFNGAAAPSSLKSKSQKKQKKTGGSKTKTNHAKVSEKLAAAGAQFIASTLQPNLSSLLKKRGFNGDLKTLVTDAQHKIDLDQVSPLVSDDEDDAQSVPTPTSASSASNRLIVKPKARRGNTSGVRMPTRAPAGPSRLQINTFPVGGGDGTLSATSSMPNSSVNTPALEGATQILTSESPMDIDQHGNRAITSASSLATISPNAADNLPGLITDNEDDNDYMDSEQETCTNDDDTRHRNKFVDMGVRVRDADETSQHGDDLIRQFDHAKTSGPAHSLAATFAPNPSNNNPSPSTPAVATPRKRGRPRKNP